MSQSMANSSPSASQAQAVGRISALHCPAAGACLASGAGQALVDGWLRSVSPGHRHELARLRSCALALQSYVSRVCARRRQWSYDTNLLRETTVFGKPGGSAEQAQDLSRGPRHGIGTARFCTCRLQVVDLEGQFPDRSCFFPYPASAGRVSAKPNWPKRQRAQPMAQGGRVAPSARPWTVNRSLLEYGENAPFCRIRPVSKRASPEARDPCSKQSFRTQRVTRDSVSTLGL